MARSTRSPSPGPRTESVQSIEHFWINYARVLRRFRVPDRSVPWYRRRVEDFIEAHPGMRLKEHTPESVTAWLETLGRNPSLADWQFRQSVDALRLLFCRMLQRGWCRGFDWAYWSEGGKRLEADHTTRLRSGAMPGTERTAGWSRSGEK